MVLEGSQAGAVHPSEQRDEAVAPLPPNFIDAGLVKDGGSVECGTAVGILSQL